MQLKPCSFLEKSTLTFVPSYHYCLNDTIHTFECIDAEKSGCEINIYELETKDFKILKSKMYPKSQNFEENRKI